MAMRWHPSTVMMFSTCVPAQSARLRRLEETQKREVFQTVSELSRRDGILLFVSIDDTVLPKTVPSSKAKRPTEGTGWHYSHLEGKVVYRHQVHAAIVGAGDTLHCVIL